MNVNLNKNVWISKGRTAWGTIPGGANTIAGYISGPLIRTMEKDNLLNKIDANR